MSIKDDLIETIAGVFREAIPPPSEDYPKEAVSLGTYVRSSKWNRLGIITDGFYGDIDKDGQKIIMYTVLFLPNTAPGAYHRNLLTTAAYGNPQMFLANEVEYDLTYYLMISPANIKDIDIYTPSGENI